jgi:hypothetical protein
VSELDRSAPGGRVALYRFYDACEELLYVGISNEPWRRRREHAYAQPWFPRVKHQAITWYDTEREAREAENRAIGDERPHFNVAGAVRPTRWRHSIRPELWAKTGFALWAAGMIACIVAIAVPLAGPLRDALVACMIAALLAAPFVTLVAIVITAAPYIRRFGTWIERNTVWPEDRAETALKLAQDARRKDLMTGVPASTRG